MIAILVPTRGLVFTEVERQIEVLRLLKKDSIVLRSSDLPIPQSHNELVEKALLIPEVDEVLFIEEDVLFPNEGLKPVKFLSCPGDIVFMDYAVNGWSCSARSRRTKEILWCGLGFTKIKRKVFEAMEKPWFRTDKTFRLNTKEWLDQPYKYGGLDIWFFLHAREKGFKIYQIEGECKHLQIKALGKGGVNQGLHEIIVRPPISKQQYIDL